MSCGMMGRIRVKSKEFIKRLLDEMPGRHRVFGFLDDDEFNTWKTKWPSLSIPDDLLAFLREANGIDLWVSAGSPEGYYRLLPLREIDAARKLMWGSFANDMGDNDVPLPHWLAISEHQDGACYVVLDPKENRYFLMDTCGADLTCPAGTNIGELLDYVWEHWVDRCGE